MDLARPQPDRLAPLRASAEALIGTVSLAGELAGSSRALDLAGLDGEVGRLCAQALDLGPEQAARLVPLLTTLLARLERLGVQLREAA